MTAPHVNGLVAYFEELQRSLPDSPPERTGEHRDSSSRGRPHGRRPSKRLSLKAEAPIQQSQDVMDKFDRVLMSAANHKRKEVINRYGHEGCEKLLARRREEMNHYQSSIRSLSEEFSKDSSCSSSFSSENS